MKLIHMAGSRLTHGYEVDFVGYADTGIDTIVLTNFDRPDPKEFQEEVELRFLSEDEFLLFCDKLSGIAENIRESRKLQKA